uniref:Uncharacterized protein n=1 Tax=Arundo donax TaxID=35708 RepID=A0A0A9DSZ4_ARUDO
MNNAMPTCSGTSQRSCMYHEKIPTRSASTLMMLIISPLVRLCLDLLDSARPFWYTTATSADRARIPACCSRKNQCLCDRHSNTLATMKARTRSCPLLVYLSSPLRYCTRESMRYGPT